MFISEWQSQQQCGACFKRPPAADGVTDRNLRKALCLRLAEASLPTWKPSCRRHLRLPTVDDESCREQKQTNKYNTSAIEYQHPRIRFSRDRHSTHPFVTCNFTRELQWQIEFHQRRLTPAPVLSIHPSVSLIWCRRLHKNFWEDCRNCDRIIPNCPSATPRRHFSARLSKFLQIVSSHVCLPNSLVPTPSKENADLKRAGVSILSEDESWLLSWEILAMDAESRSLNAANRAQELMTGYCRKLAYQQSQIVKLEGDLQAQRIEVTKRDNEITLLKDVVAKGESDLNARDAIIAKRDSTVGIEELEIADLTEREKKALEQLAAKAAEARGQEELISKIKDDADASHTAVQQQVDTNERLKSEIEAKSSVLATKEAELAAKAEVISQKDSEIKDLKVQIEKFRVEANRAKEVMDGLHKLAKKPEKK